MATSPPPPKRPFEKVLIVGAGPAGLTLALLLAQAGVRGITVLEAWPALDTRLRATQYGTPATRVFGRIRVSPTEDESNENENENDDGGGGKKKATTLLDELRASPAAVDSFPKITWRRTADHATIAALDLGCVACHPDRMTVMPLGELVRLLHRRCEALGADVVDVRFSHRVVAVGQDGDRAWVDVEVGGEEEEEEGSEGEKEGEKKKKKKKRIERFEADYVVGCDGGTSTVRKELYGREWPGQTFDCQFIVQNVWYDGFAKHGWDGGNYMIGPDSWGLVAKRGNTGMWRVTMGDKPGLSEAEYLARRPAHLARLLPGHPSSPDQYRVGDTNMYRVHNRCVPSMRAGRVLLAADAAHVCNPMGGLGCMTALVDVDGLASCLAALRDGRAGDEILDVWARVRREKFLRYVDRRSVMNLDRVSRFDPWTVGDTDPFFDLIREHEHDAEKRRAFLLKVQSIEYDFKQHFKTP